MLQKTAQFSVSALVLAFLTIVLLPVVLPAALYATAASAPTLTVATNEALPQQMVTIPVTYQAAGESIGSVVFSLDIDATLLSFDSSDNNNDGIPDAITIKTPPAFAASVSYDASDADGEIDFALFNFASPPQALPDVEIAEITFTTGAVSGCQLAAVGFSADPPPSFGSTTGDSITGTAVPGGVNICDNTPTNTFTPTSTATPTQTATATNTPTATPTGTITPVTGATSLHLPVMLHNYPPLYTISGRVVNQHNQGLAGVTIATNTGLTAVTNSQGYYTFNDVSAGHYSLTAAKGGYNFAPLHRIVELPPQAVEQNFVGTLIPTPNPTIPPTTPPTVPPHPSCTNAVLNGGFEENNAWVIELNEYPAATTTAVVYEGARSMRVGITNAAHNRFAYSSAWQYVTLPNTFSSATLSFQLYPVSGSWINFAPSRPEIVPTNQAEGMLSGDAQYVLLFDQYGNQRTLLFQLSNAGVWQAHSYDLAAYAGQTVRLYFGVYNDGWSGSAGMFVDAVKLEICP